MIDIVLISIGILGLLIGTITDFQKREVADWVNFGMIFSGLGLRFISAFRIDWYYFFIPLVWVAVFWAVGMGMYFTGQWGGGDVKMLMALSALFGTYPFTHPRLLELFSLPHQSFFMFHFFLNVAVVGSLYGLFWGIGLAIYKRNVFIPAFKKTFLLIYKWFFLAIILGFFIIVLGFFMQELFWVTFFLGFLLALLPLLYIFSKSVEESMIRFMKTSELTEGEWIVDDIYHKETYITGPKELGITNAQIALFKKYKIRGARVKVGIPFVPAFFLAMIATMLFGNLFLLFL